jgi:hypothetical protein
MDPQPPALADQFAYLRRAIAADLARSWLPDAVGSSSSPA